MNTLIQFCSHYLGFFIMALVLFLLRAFWVIGDPFFSRSQFDEEGELKFELLVYGFGAALLLVPVVLGCLTE